MKVGVLGLQGNFREHVEMLQLLGVETVIVKLPEQLDIIDGLIIPGGESTTMIRIMEDVELKKPLINKIRDGLPVFGTCAGMILLSNGVVGYDQPTLNAIDIKVKRNAYGRQVESFEVDLTLEFSKDKPFRAIFIRAPKIVEIGKDVEVLARYENDPVLIVKDKILASSFHPELTEDTRVHEYFLDMIRR